MSRPEYSRTVDGVEFLNLEVKLCTKTAGDGLGLTEPANFICKSMSPFMRLPEAVLMMDLSPAAKLLYADIFTKTFDPNDPREYFHGHRDITNRLPMSRRTVFDAVQELIDHKLIGMEKARTSRSSRLKMTPLMAFTKDDINWDPNPEMHVKPKKAGDVLPTAHATRLTFVPLSIWITVNMVKAKMIRIVDTLLLGWIITKAKPFCYASISEMSRRLNMKRDTVSVALSRLESHYLIKQNVNRGITVTAHPGYDAPMEKAAIVEQKITDYILHRLRVDVSHVDYTD